MSDHDEHYLFIQWGEWRLRPGYESLKVKIASTWTLNPSGKNANDLPDVELSAQLARLNLAIRSLPDDEQAMLDLFYWAYRANNQGRRRLTKKQIISQSGMPKTTFYRELKRCRDKAIRKAGSIGTMWAVAERETVLNSA